ncbi:MAG: hypothetical protein M3Y44_16635 [Actinomycetota bacterium]|nr:hypothetical protein [Actinomycetota bacterium]
MSAHGRPWPTATAGCGGQAYLPLVSSALSLAERTGLQVRIGPQLNTVDVDQARVSPQPNLRLAAGEFVSQLAPDGPGSVALINTCDQGAPSRVVAVDAAGQVRQVAVGHFDGLLAGGGHPWAYQYPAGNSAPEGLNPLNGGAPLTLPAGFGVVGAYQDLIIGYQAPPAGSDPNTAGPLVILDPATGRVNATVGPGSAAATVSAGLILWTDGACTAALPCVVHRYELATGASSSRDYHLGLATDAYLGYGLVSPDQRLLAFQLHRPAPDPRFDQGHPGTPTDIAVLHLDTGQLDTVPGIELWAKAGPGLLFSPDSRWLIIGLDEGTGTSLLLWHPGLSHPAAVVEVPGLTRDTTPLTAHLTG